MTGVFEDMNSMFICLLPPVYRKNYTKERREKSLHRVRLQKGQEAVVPSHIDAF